MRKITPLILFLCVLFLNVKADNQNLFSIDEAHIQTEMNGLAELEDYLSGNQLTLAEMQEQDHFLLTGLNNSTDGMHSMFGFNEPPFGIPSLLWGFCFGVIGVVLVHLVAEDKAETRKAIIGCAISTALYVVVYFLWWSAWRTAWGW